MENTNLKTINSSDVDSNWSAEDLIVYSQELQKEKIKAARENRKLEKKDAKFRTRIRLFTAKGRNAPMYPVTVFAELMDDPRFDKEALDYLVKRLINYELIEAFRSFGTNEKEIFKMIITHPLITTSQLIEINKAKYGTYNGYLYNSRDLNLEIIKRDDCPKNIILTLVKTDQHDLKLEASKKKDLPENIKSELILYTVKHCAHVPETLMEIFKNLGIENRVTEFEKQIIAAIEKRYIGGELASRIPEKFLLCMKIYDFDVSSEQRDNIVYTYSIFLSNDFRRKSKQITAEDVAADIDKNADEKIKLDLRMRLYEQTGNITFLPDSAKELFLF